MKNLKKFDFNKISLNEIDLLEIKLGIKVLIEAIISFFIKGTIFYLLWFFFVANVLGMPDLTYLQFMVLLLLIRIVDTQF